MQAVEILKKAIGCVMKSALTGVEKAKIIEYLARDLVIAELVAEREQFAIAKLREKETGE